MVVCRLQWWYQLIESVTSVTDNGGCVYLAGFLEAYIYSPRFPLAEVSLCMALLVDKIICRHKLWCRSSFRKKNTSLPSDISNNRFTRSQMTRVVPVGKFISDKRLPLSL